MALNENSEILGEIGETDVTVPKSLAPVVTRTAHKFRP
jgi:hypothetical protein